MTERHGTFMAKERANIYTIAKEAGVSPATVSRVLTNNARVSKEKREKVQSVIQKYGYTPNALAQGLSNSKTRSIGHINDLQWFLLLFGPTTKSLHRRAFVASTSSC